MRWGDLLRIALSALYQQKTRTILSLLGVAIGTFSLAVSLAIGQGVQLAVLEQLRRNDQLRKIAVQPGYQAKPEDVPDEALEVSGAMSDAKRQRIRQALVARWGRTHMQEPRARLRADEIARLGALEHVESVTPTLSHDGRAELGDKSAAVSIGSGASDDKTLRGRVVAGGFFASNADPSVLVHEHLLYSWGYTGDDDARSLVGRTIRLEFHLARNTRWPLLSMLTGGRVAPDSPENQVLQRILKRLPALLDATEMTDAERRASKVLVESLVVEEPVAPEPAIAADFTIAGVLRQWTKDDASSSMDGNWATREADVVLPSRTAEEFFFRDPPVARAGAQHATLTVDHEDNVRSLTRTLKEMGYTVWSLEQEIDEFRHNALLITLAFTFIAAVALAVAALGITNTMTMSILERTREIGVMKAVGARDRHIRLIFLLEGALIGAAGGALGLLLSWLASFLGDAIGRSIMEQQTKAPVEHSLFAFPPLVTLGAPALACLVTTLAAYYPAGRAAGVNPVTSLRHE